MQYTCKKLHWKQSSWVEFEGGQLGSTFNSVAKLKNHVEEYYGGTPRTIPNLEVSLKSRVGHKGDERHLRRALLPVCIGITQRQLHWTVEGETKPLKRECVNTRQLHDSDSVQRC